MTQPSPFYIILLLVLLTLPMAGENIGRSFGGDFMAIIGAVAGLLCTVLISLIWVRFARTEQVEMLAGLAVSSVTVQSWNLATAKSLSSDMRLMTTVGWFLLTWYVYNKILRSCFVELQDESSISNQLPPLASSDERGDHARTHEASDQKNL